MRLLLTSFLHDFIPNFVRGRRIAYVADAARAMPEADFAKEERRRVAAYGLELIDLPLGETPPADARRALAGMDGVYVAGGDTFGLLHALRRSGNLDVLREAVRAGLPYVGTSAGAVIAAHDITYIAPMDAPDSIPDASESAALGLTDLCVVPHAGGNLPPYPIGVIADIVRRSGEKKRLVLLRDGEALHLDGGRAALLG